MWPFDDIGSTLGGELKAMISSSFEATMELVWKASLGALKLAFGLVDQFTVFTVSTSTGPVSILWPMMLWISGVLALGLFFWQLAGTVLCGGRGFVRLIVGPAQYGVALALSVGLIAAVLAAVDGITEGILTYGLRAENFTDALDATGFLDANADGAHAVVLGFLAITGVFPAALGYTLEMLFREAAILILVTTIPINAAGLLSGPTAIWFWRTVRWLAVCIGMEPVLALALVIGVATSGGSQGLSGLLAGVGVLMISLTCPFVLFRLFAFVDPSTDAGAAFRDYLSSRGIDSYGENNPASLASNTIANGINGGSGGGGSSETEDANTSRFDDAAAKYADDEMDESGVGDDSVKQRRAEGARQNSDEGLGDGGSDDPGNADGGAAEPPPANYGTVVSSSLTSGPSGDYGDNPDDSGAGPSGPGNSSAGGRGGAKSGGGGKGTAAGAEEAAVIV